VGGKPLLEHVLEKVEQVDAVDEVYLITNAKFFYSFLEWAKLYNSGNQNAKRVEVINDGTDSNENRLGALGDVQFAIDKKRIKDDILLIAADNLFEFSLGSMHSMFKKHNKTTIALYDVKDKKLASHYGVVEIKENRLVHFVEKPKQPRSTLISTGIYMIPKQDVALFKLYLSHGKSTDKIGSFFEWLHTREDVYCHVTTELWYDIGTLDQLEEARQHFAKKRVDVMP
jgi:glucose-1-phosphate thymidylyltransferase